MAYQLTRLRTGIGETKTIHNVVEATFKEMEQIFTGYTAHLIGALIVPAELTFQYTINPLCFLLFAQLNSIVGFFLLTTLTMHTRGIIAIIQRAFSGKAFFAF
jgi:hypothetical protein